MADELIRDKFWAGPLQDFADSNGRAEVVFDQQKPGNDILLEYLIVRVTGSTNIPTAFVFIGDERDSNIVDGTSNGDLDFSPYMPRLFVPAGKELRIVWEDCAQDDKATARFQYLMPRG